jgi:hypothetical protein
MAAPRPTERIAALILLATLVSLFLAYGFDPRDWWR